MTQPRITATQRSLRTSRWNFSLWLLLEDQNERWPHVKASVVLLWG